MEFVKMEGLGNDFVVIESDRAPEPDDIRRWCDRRRGVGADGVLRVTPTGGETAIRMEYWNADGSAAEMCGNGLRCAARYGYDQGWALSTSFAVHTPVGVNRAEIVGPGVVRVELGTFSVGGEVSVAGAGFRCASVGNPHAVTFVADPAAAPVDTLGPQVETDPQFPDGTNVEFASVTAAGLRLRVWERGVGETAACGTGAAAAVAVAHAAGRAGPVATVELPGGELRVELEGDRAWITGPASYVYRGRILTDDRLSV